MDAVSEKVKELGEPVDSSTCAPTMSKLVNGEWVQFHRTRKGWEPVNLEAVQEPEELIIPVSEELWEFGVVVERFRPWHKFTFVNVGDKTVYASQKIFECCVGLRAGSSVLVRAVPDAMGLRAIEMKFARKPQEATQ